MSKALMLAEFGLRMIAMELRLGQAPEEAAKTATAYALMAQQALGWTEAKVIEREKARERIGLSPTGRKPTYRRDR